MNINELEQYFKTIELPKTMQLNSFTFVNDVKFLIESNLRYLKAHPGSESFRPYYNQLLEIKRVLEQLNK